MSDSDPPDDSEARLFRASIGEVTRLHHDKIAHERRRPGPRPRQHERDERQVLQDMMSDVYDSQDIQPGDQLSFCRPGIQRTVFRKLKRGEYTDGAELDLHGMNVAQARVALVQFLLEADALQSRCVRVIHGKGKRSDNQGPVLKGMVNKWLRQRDEVLAFVSARPVDGGTGAVYVLLKRRRG